MAHAHEAVPGRLEVPTDSADRDDPSMPDVTVPDGNRGDLRVLPAFRPPSVPALPWLTPTPAMRASSTPASRPRR